MKPIHTRLFKLILIPIILFFGANTPLKAQQAASLSFTLVDDLNWGNNLVAATQVTETYTYNKLTDTVTISYQFNQVGFSPLPPMLSIAYQYGFPLTVNQPVVNTGHFTQIGPLLGVANTDHYEVQITGLGKYVTESRILRQGIVPPNLINELETQVNKVTNSGHLIPGLFLSNVPGCLGGGCDERGHVYWYNPADTLYFLSEFSPLLPPNSQQSVLDYLESERASFPPEFQKSMPFNTGSQRTVTNFPTQLLQSTWHDRHVYFRTHGEPKIWNLYGLARYYEATQQIPDQTVTSQATHIVTTEMNYRDWATLYWQSSHWPEYNAVHSVNQLFSGLVGYIRLTQLTGDTTHEQVGWGLFARMAVLRFAMAKYTQFEFDTNQFIIDPEICGTTNEGCNPRPNWWSRIYQNKNHPFWSTNDTWGGSLPSWTAQLTTQNWTKPIDNVRQVHRLDNQGVRTWEWFGWGGATGTINSGGSGNVTDGQNKTHYWTSLYGAYLLPFADLTPELARFMKDFLRPESEAYVKRVEENVPTWYKVYAQPAVGIEQGYLMPIDSYSIFMAKNWIINLPPDKLNNLISYSWLNTGDYFYLHKLAETIKAYRGWCWSIDGINCSDSNSTVLWGDLNQDSAIDYADYSLFLPSFNSLFSIFDLNRLINWFGHHL